MRIQREVGLVRARATLFRGDSEKILPGRRVCGRDGRHGVDGRYANPIQLCRHEVGGGNQRRLALAASATMGGSSRMGTVTLKANGQGSSLVRVVTRHD
jgi:hypothetical protein